MLLTLSGTATGAAARFTPPPAPLVAPVVGNDYPNDADKNRIDDQLQEQAVNSARPGNLDAQADDQRVSVELIFSKPVTQSQIDTFLDMGGSIVYVYQTVSYGWIGRIALDRISALPDSMGSTLVLVEPTIRVRLYNTDRATLGTRVRPVWKSGFAGNVSGFSGDPNTTIGFTDTGVDASHSDMVGRLVYWNDLTDSHDPNPSDDDGHGTATSGMALGTGKASGVNAGPFTFTYTDPVPDFGYGYLTYPIGLPDGAVTLTTKASWTGASASLYHIYWPQGTPPNSIYNAGSSNTSGTTSAVLSNSFTASSTRDYSVYLYNPLYRFLYSTVIVTTVSNYPAVGDGFARFRGVAPGCNYAMVRIPLTGSEAEFENALSAGLDLLVTNRVTKSIKIISLSVGLADDVTFLPKQSTSLRNKIASAVNSGIIVVSAAGNEATGSSEAARAMSDPARAAMAITVGASNEKNALTDYSTYGFANPNAQLSEDYKPDLIAPGGSFYYSCLAAPDSGTSDALGADVEPNDYIVAAGTSFSSPFIAGCAALVIQAMERQGVHWDFTSSLYPRYVKMVLCATASETNANRESNTYNPTLQRAAGGPSGFPAGKDRYEGYGLINADAAVEAASLTYSPTSVATDTFGSGTADRRVWARTMDLKLGRDITVSLANPVGGDFDLYVYSGVPSDTGTPVLLASSTNAGNGVAEQLAYSPTADGKALLVVKRVAGSGAFTLNSTMAGPPTARDVHKNVAINSTATITLDAIDDGLPNPPGALTYTIASLPQHGQIEQVSDGSVIAFVPATLAAGVKQVVYRPAAGWVGDDSFTYYSDDGGMAPFGGSSNAATVFVSTVREITVTYQVAASADDASVMRGSSFQDATQPMLSVGLSNAGMRFAHVDIPHGSHIIRADLKIRSYTSGIATLMTVTIQAEASDNAADLSNRTVNAVPTTAASQSWPLTASWQTNTWYQSPDIAGVIQEVTDRPNWSANNALMVVCLGDWSAPNERKFWSYDGDPASAPQLEITYQP
jgi:hypothetical protein